MARRVTAPLVFGAAAAGVVWLGWRGSPAGPATPASRAGLIAAVVMLAAVPWGVRKVLGPAGGVPRGPLARVARSGGYAVALALVLAEARVEPLEHAGHPGRAWLAGTWAGEIIFVVILAGYVAALLVATARRLPGRWRRARPGTGSAPRPGTGPAPRLTASRAALVIGTRAGLAAGLAVYAMRALAAVLPARNGWPTWLHRGASALFVLTAAGLIVAAGRAAARRTRPGGGTGLPLADARARQGVAAGLCAGLIGAALVCLLGAGTAALVPHAMKPLQWSFAGGRPMNSAVYEFETSVTDSAAGYLLVLVFGPVLGAGLGAWGGLSAAGRPRPRPDGGGGGGGRPEPAPPPPQGSGRRGDDHEPAILRGYLVRLPAVPGLPGTGRDAHGEPQRPDPRQAPV
jgi:hypothetical protein